MHTNVDSLVLEWNQLTTFEKLKFCYRIKTCSIKSWKFSVSISFVFDKITIRISSTEEIFYAILKNIFTIDNKNLKIFTFRTVN